jgi:hypothetical protein
MVLNLFSNNLFWDVETATLDLEKHIRFIIERVLMRGRLVDWSTLLQVYSAEQIKREIVKIRYLDKVTLQFCVTFFQVPKSRFRCYKLTRSNPELWKF